MDRLSGLWAKMGEQKMTQLSRYARKLVYEAPAMRSVRIVLKNFSFSVQIFFFQVDLVRLKASVKRYVSYQ